MSIRKRLTIFICLSITLTIVAFSYLGYRQNKSALVYGVDKELLSVTTSVEAMLGKNYHDNITSEDSVSAEQYNRIVDAFNNICIGSEIQYIWSVLVDERGRVRFTTATSPDHDIKKGDHAWFFDIHNDPKSFDAAFEAMVPHISNFDNEWGSGR
jgi:hypothetical protein